jgi:hypothetical protein
LFVCLFVCLFVNCVDDGITPRLKILLSSWRFRNCGDEHLFTWYPICYSIFLLFVISEHHSYLLVRAFGSVFLLIRVGGAGVWYDWLLL